MKKLFALALGVLALTGCSTAESECSTNADCGDRQVCSDGTCYAGTCANGGITCGAGFECVNNTCTSTAPNTFTVGGSVTGLSGTVVLAMGTQTVSVSANGNYTFPTAVASGTAYTVTVQTQPSGQTCTVANGTGTVASANVTNVNVTCAAAITYAIGGNVTGLVGTLVLQNNAGDDETITANGAFTFNTEVAGAYDVTVLTQPVGLTCAVTNGSGTPSADVTDVAVNCTPNAMVLRVGNGQAPPASGVSVAISLVEVAAGSTTAVRTIEVPTAEASMTYNSTSEGGISRSADAKHIALAAYRVATGTQVTGTGAVAATRTAVGVSATGAFTYADFAGAFLGSNVRGAATTNGADFWLSGTSSGTPSSGGVWYKPSGGAALNIAAAPNNSRWLAIFGDQLYLSSGSSPYVGVNTVGSGTPTTSPQTVTNIAVNATYNSPYGFAFVDTDATAGVDTLYVAYDNAPTDVNVTNVINVRKFTLNTGTGVWVLSATFAPTHAEAKAGARGVAATRLPNGTTLVYAVTGTSGTASAIDNRVVKFIDDGTANPVASDVVSAGENYGFRGLAIAPVVPAQ